MTEPKVSPIAARAAGCPFDPAPALYEALEDDELRRCPVPSPMGEFEAVVVTRYQDARAVLGSDQLRMGGAMPFQPGNLMSYDGEEHTRLRRRLTGSFTTKRARELRPMIEGVVADVLDGLEKAGPGSDLVAHFSMPIPTQVICALLGVPYEDREEFQRRTEAVLDVNSTFEQQMRAVAEVNAYMGVLVARHREEPGDDLLGGIVREHGAELTDDELAGVGNMLLIAGHETISSTLAASVALLLRHSDQLAIVRDEPDAIDGAVEELLRFCAPATILPRKAAGEIQVRDRVIDEGEFVVVSALAANRDLESGEDLDRLDVRRPLLGHLAFGFGPHQCLGRQLARMELRVALPALLNRFPELRTAVPADEVDYRTSALVFGVNSLPVTW
ncbi:cytochrome P450 [Lentzea sp. NPDC059081]|uniref:cytochrome P450 n=1 Tax=Lentzea sp. NPDC059081 TaxID=3346719 RepID=UPI00369B6C7E